MDKTSKGRDLQQLFCLTHFQYLRCGTRYGVLSLRSDLTSTVRGRGVYGRALLRVRAAQHLFGAPTFSRLSTHTLLRKPRFAYRYLYILRTTYASILFAGTMATIIALPYS